MLEKLIDNFDNIFCAISLPVICLLYLLYLLALLIIFCIYYKKRKGVYRFITLFYALIMPIIAGSVSDIYIHSNYKFKLSQKQDK